MPQTVYVVLDGCADLCAVYSTPEQARRHVCDNPETAYYVGHVIEPPAPDPIYVIHSRDGVYTINIARGQLVPEALNAPFSAFNNSAAVFVRAASIADAFARAVVLLATFTPNQGK